MKVTVCFNAIRVVVPCGNGDLLVRELINEAIRRYKKAVGKDSWVVVHHLQSQSGILDPDDRVLDVADDREQILASYDDTGPEPGVPQGGGDGASGSSVGTGSPDIFRVPTTENKYDDAAPQMVDVNQTPHIEVTANANGNSTLGVGLMVRRSSDPSLHQAGFDHHNIMNTVKQQQDATKRWSAAPVCRTDAEPTERMLHEKKPNNIGYLEPAWENEDVEEAHNSTHNESMHNSFSRSGRLSMQFLGDGNGHKWMDAADRVQAGSFNSKSLPRDSKRKEPLGQAYESIREKNGEMLLIINEHGGPLGMTAIPDIENGGLLVQQVESGGRAERSRLRRGDRIVEINGTKLTGMTDLFVQNHLKSHLAAPELRLRVIRGTSIASRLRKDNGPSDSVHSTPTKVAAISPTRKIPGVSTGSSLQVANTRKLGRRILIELKKGPDGLGFSVTTRDNPAGGHCPIYIKNVLPRGAAIKDGRLKPGDRLLEVDDIPMTGKSQNEVVAILRATQSGALVKIVVSRQQELVEQDEREIGYDVQTFMDMQDDTSTQPPKPPAPVLPNKSNFSTSTSNVRSQSSEPKGIVFTSPETEKVNVNEIKQRFQSNQNQRSQQQPETPAPNQKSSQLWPTLTAKQESQIFPWRNREVMTLHIPVHDTEKAGLGVSVKGKTGSMNSSDGSSGEICSKTDGDLGIFIKSVIHGGAASRDGRLKMNDQLLNVNGVSLLGQSNAEAMETLRRAMMHTGGNYPGMITLTVARKAARPVSTISSMDTSLSEGDSFSTSEQSGKTVIYLNPDGASDKKMLADRMNRWSNPVLDRLTGGGQSGPQFHRPPSLYSQGLRNESYYMATNDTWSPNNPNVVNNSVLIEEDPEPVSPALPPANINSRPMEVHSPPTPHSDATYSSQLSLDNNLPNDAFSRDAVGRRSISEKHHAALDAKETGTYQRNKKLREQREREREMRGNNGSADSLANLGRHLASNYEMDIEAMDRIGELGPSLGLKKSSSLESLQTMVQEIQMADEPRGPTALRTPRGRCREESLRAAVERPSMENRPKKHWLLEDGTGPSDNEGGFIVRNGPLQSSLHEGKNKHRPKKPSLLKGIGHMFRFGKHRKDGILPSETLSEFGGGHHIAKQPSYRQDPNHLLHDGPRPPGGPPIYQPPPPPIANGNSGQNDLFNQRYALYVNYDELQHQIRKSSSSPQIHKPVKKASTLPPASASPAQQHQHEEHASETMQTASDHLSDSMIEQMRRQVMHQRVKVEEESRRHQHYHSQRITRTTDASSHHQHHHQNSAPSQRPASSYYEYESSAPPKHSSPAGPSRKISAPSPPRWPITSGASTIGSSGRNRGPFVTQVTIRDQNHHLPHQPASKV